MIACLHPLKSIPVMVNAKNDDGRVMPETRQWGFGASLAPFDENEQQPWDISTSSQNFLWKQERWSSLLPIS